MDAQGMIPVTPGALREVEKSRAGTRVCVERDGGLPNVLCSSCGARSTLPDRCTNCGATGAHWPAALSSDERFARFGPTAPTPGWGVPDFRSVRGPATALYVLLGVSAVTSLLAAIAFFRRAALVDDALNNRWLTSEPDEANHDIAIWWGLAGLAIVTTMVMFVIWFHRARRNVDAFAGPGQPLSTGWAIGGWLCPVVNLWFPLMIAHGIWKASDPRAPMRGGATPGRHPLLWAWWLTYLAANAVFFVSMGTRSTAGRDDLIGSDDWTRYHESYRDGDTAAGWSFLLLVAAAGLAAAVVARVTGFQNEHERARFGFAGKGYGHAMPSAAYPSVTPGHAPPAYPPAGHPPRPHAPGSQPPPRPRNPPAW